MTTYFPSLKRASTENKERLIRELVLNEPNNSKFECKGKRQYDSKKEIMKDILRMMNESYGGFGFLRPYRCKYCKKWHLTSSN